MKRALLLLLFVNAVYFLWSQIETAAPVSEELTAPLYNAAFIEVLKLVEAKEIEKSNETRLVEQAVLERGALEKLLSVGPKRIIECYMLGDFSSAIRTERLARKLRALTDEVAVAAIKPKTEYWIIYSAGKTWEDSLKNVKMLKSKGMSDLWLVPSGKNKGVISLGLYTEEDRADARLQILRNKKINAKIVTRVKYRYSVRTKIIGGLEVLKSYLEKESIVKTVSISKISC